jgi:putative ABC transport system permease protein
MFAPKYLYVPLRTGSQISHKEESFQYVQVISGVGVDPEALSKEITTFFEPYYRNNASYKVTALTLSGMVRMLTTLLGTITTAISIIAGISLLVGGIGVMNIMLVSVTERTREIGTRKALGAKNSSIRVQFIVEAMIICLIGGFIGLILGMVLGITASNILGYPARPSISGIIISIGFSMAIGLFFGYFPANKAAKMNPIDALRYE